MTKKKSVDRKDDEPETEEARLLRLERKGIVRLPVKKLSLEEWRKLPRPDPDPENLVLKELIQGRREER